MDNKTIKRLEKTLDGTYEITYKEIKRIKLTDKDEFERWLYSKFPKIEEMYCSNFIGRYLQYDINVGIVKVIVDYLEVHGFLPRREAE